MKIFLDFSQKIDPRDIYLELRTAGRGELFTTVRVGNLEFDKYRQREYKNL
jgi:hypothetical protein